MSELVLVANAGDGTISTLRLHRDPPRLEPLAVSPVGEGTGTFAVDAVRNLVYAAYKGDPAGIVTLSLDRETGELTALSRRDVDSSLSYLSLAHDNTVLLGASYGGGFGGTWTIGDDGQLGKMVDRAEFANAHCFVARDRYAYLVSLGEDLIAQFALLPDGTLTPLDPPTVAAPAGSGPRHLVFGDARLTSSGSNAYVMTEFSGEAIRYQINSDGTLARCESVPVFDPAAGLQHSRLGAKPRDEHLIWGADLHLAGPWLLCSERTASTIASVAMADGELRDVVALTPTQTQPRGFAVTGDGKYLVAVGERATSAALSQVESDGRLSLLGEAPVGTGANWVRILSDRNS